MKISEKEIEELCDSSTNLYEKLLQCIIANYEAPSITTLAVVRVLAATIAADLRVGIVKEGTSFDEYFDSIVDMLKNFTLGNIEDGTGN